MESRAAEFIAYKYIKANIKYQIGLLFTVWRYFALFKFHEQYLILNNLRHTSELCRANLERKEAVLFIME